ncbi:type II toxin-antitoxin system RelE/ParE family toxin [Parapedobacter pyrenivorans]|uniref:type II toxin-antitoxin system RelE/ParE family toxin n=1 Tax=Parapedobacter pyrenivorans TaxID=1305674 RepID=UPI00333F0F12
MVTVWSKRAKKELTKAFEYISLESPQNARKVVETIVDITLALPENPLKNPLDKYKKDNDGSWRAFEKYHFRISYRVLEKEIRIVRFRHTSRTPLNY